MIRTSNDSEFERPHLLRLLIKPNSSLNLSDRGGGFVTFGFSIVS